MMFYAAVCAIGVTMCLAVARALLGPGVYNRLLAANLFGTKTVLLLAVVAVLSDRPEFLDLALAYALINFIGVLAVLEFVQSRALRRRLEDSRRLENDQNPENGPALTPDSPE